MLRPLPLTALLCICACSGPGGAVSGDAARARPVARPVDVPVEASVRRDAIDPVPRSQELGPEILLPASPAVDAVVATVGERVIRKSHVYDRWLQTLPRDTLTMVDLLVMDAVVAEQAERFEIQVTADEVSALVREEIDGLRASVERSFGGEQTLDQYLQRTEGMSAEGYEAFLQREIARQRYRSYVIRYMAMLEDRVEVRFIVHRDRAVVDDVREKVGEGADFATLARRHSEDESTRDKGGLLSPFARGHQHPIAVEAFRLQPGEMSPVVTREEGGIERHYLVYCIAVMPKQDAPFQEVKEELAMELVRRPVESLEHTAFFVRWCRPSSVLNSGREGR